MGLLNECKGNNSSTKERKIKSERGREREKGEREFVLDKNEDFNGIKSAD